MTRRRERVPMPGNIIGDAWAAAISGLLVGASLGAMIHAYLGGCLP